MEIQPDTLTRTHTQTGSTRPARASWPLAGAAALPALLALLAVLAHPGTARAQASQPTSQPTLSAGRLETYIARVARAWVPYTTAQGRVADPLNPADTGDNYGVILLADAMLKVAARTDDGALEAAGVRILEAVASLPAPNDPFNLFAIAAVIHDGRAGELPAGAWDRLAEPLALLAGRIGPPSAVNCLTEPGCYSNWRLVWSAGAALLAADGVAGAPGSLAGESAWVATQIKGDLVLAVTNAGAPLLASQVLGGRARELSDPGAEPPAYELFSAFMLATIAEVDPSAVTPAVARLRIRADRYALDMMAPDGQLSLSGRSLDQSWVQAAAAALGAGQAALEPQYAPAWSAYAERATSYLLSAYPLQPDGLLPIVPGLDFEWSPSIMDGYAALNQYEGLTLWLLSDALARWPSTQTPRASLPADRDSLLADDLAASGLVWGRSGPVWWELSGRSTSSDPRSAQGLVAVKLDGTGGWRDLLALRPIHHGLSSVWTLGLAHGATATAAFDGVRGTGHSVVLAGDYRRAGGHVVARATWRLSTTATGVRLSMSVPARATLHTTVWLAPGAPRLYAPGATTTSDACLVTASGRACPVTIRWPRRPRRHADALEIAAR